MSKIINLEEFKNKKDYSKKSKTYLEKYKDMDIKKRKMLNSWLEM